MIPSNRQYGLLQGFLFLAVTLALNCHMPFVEAASVTRSADVASLASLKMYHTIPNFRIGGVYNLDDESSYAFGGQGGTTLESLGQEPLRLGYITVGKAEKDDQGQIINAVVINSFYSGGSTSMYNFWYEGQAGNDFCQGGVVGPGKLIDTDKYFVVFIDSLGLWGASKPSDGLGMKFPQYKTFDLVQASYRLLRDKLKVATVKLTIGVSMGGSQAFVWGVLHPEYVEAIIPIGGTTQSDANDPVQKWLFQLMTAAIKGDPVWRETGGDYYHLPKSKHPNKGVEFGWSILGHTGFTLPFRALQPWSVVEKEVFFWDPQGEASESLRKKAADFDANDLLYRNAAGNTYNINSELHRVQARTLVIHVKTDQWLNYRLAETATAKIKGARLIGFSSPLAHYAAFQAPNLLHDDVKAFLEGKSCSGGSPAAVSSAEKAAEQKGAFSK